MALKFEAYDDSVEVARTQAYDRAEKSSCPTKNIPRCIEMSIVPYERREYVAHQGRFGLRPLLPARKLNQLSGGYPVGGFRSDYDLCKEGERSEPYLVKS